MCVKAIAPTHLPVPDSEYVTLTGLNLIKYICRTLCSKVCARTVARGTMIESSYYDSCTV